MHRDVLKHFTYANVVATVACFLALGGASYAAFVLPADSVKPRQLAFPLGTKVVTGGRRTLHSGDSDVVLTRTRITLKRASKVLLIGSAGVDEFHTDGCVAAFAGQPPNPQTFDLDAWVELNGSTSNVKAGGGDYGLTMSNSPFNANFSQIVTVPAGRHVVALIASDLGPCRTTFIGASQLAVIALPALGSLPDLSLKPPP